MKKLLIFIFSIMMLFSFSACSKTLNGEDGIIEKVREEISLADAENIEIKIIGSHFLGDKHLFWLMTGNEYQANSYFVMETEVKSDEKYEFIKLYDTLDKGMDIRTLYYTGVSGNVLDTYYLFMVNNEDCVKMRLNNEEINIENHPFVYSLKDFEGEYAFLDKDGNEIY